MEYKKNVRKKWFTRVMDALAYQDKMSKRGVPMTVYNLLYTYTQKENNLVLPDERSIFGVGDFLSLNDLREYLHGLLIVRIAYIKEDVGVSFKSFTLFREVERKYDIRY